jgi:hypothetical protein
MVKTTFNLTTKNMDLYLLACEQSTDRRVD